MMLFNNIITHEENCVNNKEEKMKNVEIKEYAKAHGILLWRIADRLGITDSYFSKKLRYEFSAEEKQRIVRIIDELTEEHQ